MAEREYEVTLPMAGHLFLSVMAASKEDAIEKAMQEVSINDLGEWEPMVRFNQGNVCYCPHPWEAHAEPVDEDEEFPDEDD